MNQIPKSNQKILKVVIGTILALTLLFTLVYQLGYRINLSKSYPKGIYKTIPKKTIEHGDFVMFCPKDSPLMQEALKRNYILNGTCDGGFYPLLKKVVGLQGDKVDIKDYVYINGKKQKKGKLYKKDPKGNLLPRSKEGNITIAKGYMFLLSDYHELSFDSRYIGAVEINRTLSLMKSVYLWK
ncbi:MAG: Signal peptidase I [uncultured Sulfurovum sp.]|uniref:Signal peptidase I n=1 Tax=uncultured Sulfurovum sp. TaxID=269237 RepID=A0A6S6T7I3_9BACT|nr:MAG: Signal peptidase I [uncultured Sulfurovum sp.]